MKRSSYLKRYICISSISRVHNRQKNIFLLVMFLYANMNAGGRAFGDGRIKIVST